MIIRFFITLGFIVIPVIFGFPSEMIAQDLSEELILHYDFDNNYEDSSTNGFDGEGINTTFVPDRFGNPSQAVEFNGFTCVNFPNNSLLRPEFPFSFSIWAFPYEIQIDNSSNYPLISTDQALDNYYGAFVSILPTGQLIISYGDGSGCTGPQCRRGLISEKTLSVNKWYHIVANFFSPTEMELYVNGCLTPTEQSGIGNFSILYSEIPGALGKNDHSERPEYPVGYFKGILDDFYFWNRTIDMSEVEILFNDFYNSGPHEIIYEGCQSDGYSTVVNGMIYDETNPIGTEIFTSYFGCDSVITIDLKFNDTYSEEVEGNYCEEENYSIEINGTIYDLNNPTGTEILETQYGCDSVININLNFQPLNENTIEYNRCEEDGFAVEVNGTIYSQSNPSGMEQVESTDGCDTLITIELNYHPQSSTNITYTGVSDDNYSVIVNGNVYNEENPTGVEILKNQMNCDSIISVNLVFQDSEACEYFVPNVFSRSGQSLNSIFAISKPTGCSIIFKGINIYNRWGDLIFNSGDENFKWDGTFKNEIVAGGVFPYLLEYSLNGAEYVLPGTITFLK